MLEELSGGEVVLKPVDMTPNLPLHKSKKYGVRDQSRINLVVLHCTDRDWTTEQLAEYDVNGQLTYERKLDGKLITDHNHISKKGLPGITYHYTTDENRVYKTLNHAAVSWHAAGYNTRSLALAMLYRTTNPATKKAEYKPPEKMIKLAQCQAAELCLELKLTPDKIKGHRELRGTGWEIIKGRKRLVKTCPGPYVDLDQVRRNAALYMQVRLRLEGKYKGEIDGIFGPRSRESLENY